MPLRFIAITSLLFLSLVTITTVSEAAPPRFLRTGGLGMRSMGFSETEAILFGSTPIDTDTYSSGWVDSAVGGSTSTISSGGTSGLSTYDTAFGVGIDGQTILSTPMIAQGGLILEKSGGGGVIDGSFTTVTEWDVEWIVDDEGGTRDYSHEYLMECSITFSWSAASSGVGPLIGTAAFPSAAGVSGFSDSDFFIYITAGAETISITYDAPSDKWISYDGDVFIDYDADGEVNIVVSRDVTLSDGDFVTVFGRMGYSENATSARSLYESVSGVTVDAKLIP